MFNNDNKSPNTHTHSDTRLYAERKKKRETEKEGVGKESEEAVPPVRPLLQLRRRSHPSLAKITRRKSGRVACMCGVG